MKQITFFPKIFNFFTDLIFLKNKKKKKEKKTLKKLRIKKFSLFSLFFYCEFCSQKYLRTMHTGNDSN